MTAAVAVWLGSGAASAHGGGDGPPGADLPRVVAVTPAVAGLAVTVVEGGLRLRVDNATAGPVLLPGGDPVAPGSSADLPAPDAAVWTLPLTADGHAVTVSGDRVAPPAPDPVPWWAFTLAAALLSFAAAAGSAAALAAVTLLAVAAHAVHVAGASLALAVPPGPGTFLAAAGPALVAWLLGIGGAVLVLRGEPLGVPACAAGGTLVALLTVFDVTAFHRAVLVFGWSFDVDRVTTVLTVGCGAGLLATGVVVLAREPERA